MISAYVYFSYTERHFVSITSFDECVSAGYPILETYPETCMLPGKRFTNPRQTKTEEKQAIAKKLSLHEQVLDKKYLVNGQNIFVSRDEKSASTNSSWVTTLPDRFIETDATGDTKNDIVFLAHNATTSSLYVLLAVGLYDGLTPANGILIGESDGTSTLQMTATGTLEVVTFTKKGKEVRKTFITENDILKEY